jgi:hypothetical protein
MTDRIASVEPSWWRGPVEARLRATREREALARARAATRADTAAAAWHRDAADYQAVAVGFYEDLLDGARRSRRRRSDLTAVRHLAAERRDAAAERLAQIERRIAELRPATPASAPPPPMDRAVAARDRLIAAARFAAVARKGAHRARLLSADAHERAAGLDAIVGNLVRAAEHRASARRERQQASVDGPWGRDGADGARDGDGRDGHGPDGDGRDGRGPDGRGPSGHGRDGHGA